MRSKFYFVTHYVDLKRICWKFHWWIFCRNGKSLDLSWFSEWEKRKTECERKFIVRHRRWDTRKMQWVLLKNYNPMCELLQVRGCHVAQWSGVKGVRGKNADSSSDQRRSERMFINLFSSFENHLSLLCLSLNAFPSENNRTFFQYLVKLELIITIIITKNVIIIISIPFA